MASWQGFYSTSQVSRLARIPMSTLHDWKARGIIKPSMILQSKGLVALEGYSYADLTIIKILRALREDKLDLTSAGVALRHLWDRLGPPSHGWANASVYLKGNHIFAEKQDEWNVTAATGFGQKVETRFFGDLFKELKQQEEEGSILVPDDFREFIEIKPGVMGGEPVIRGTRVPTSIFAVLKAKGKTSKQLAQLYRPITEKAIETAIAYEDFLAQPIAQT